MMQESSALNWFLMLDFMVTFEAVEDACSAATMLKCRLDKSTPLTPLAG